MKMRGKAHRFGDDINTDVHLSVKYRPPETTFEQLKEDAMRELDPDFASSVREGDVVVAGENFGLVSSRADAALVLQALGVSCVLAKSYGHMFFRNAINMGLPVIECDTDGIAAGDLLEIDPEAGEVRVRDETIRFKPFPSTLWAVLEAGGLEAYLQREGDYPAE